jgi:hypothetical protein
MKSPYSTTYAEARRQFLDAARASNATGDTLPQDVAALHIHAINPYGFAWP